MINVGIHVPYIVYISIESLRYGIGREKKFCESGIWLFQPCCSCKGLKKLWQWCPRPLLRVQRDPHVSDVSHGPEDCNWFSLLKQDFHEASSEVCDAIFKGHDVITGIDKCQKKCVPARYLLCEIEDFSLQSWLMFLWIFGFWTLLKGNKTRAWWPMMLEWNRVDI